MQHRLSDPHPFSPPELERVNVSEAISELLAVQPAEELETARKAAQFSALFMQKACRKAIMSIVENNDVRCAFRAVAWGNCWRRRASRRHGTLSHVAVSLSCSFLLGRKRSTRTLRRSWRISCSAES